MLNWTTQALNSVMATSPNPAVLAARESAAAAAALVGNSPLASLSFYAPSGMCSPNVTKSIGPQALPPVVCAAQKLPNPLFP